MSQGESDFFLAAQNQIHRRHWLSFINDEI